MNWQPSALRRGPCHTARLRCRSLRSPPRKRILPRSINATRNQDGHVAREATPRKRRYGLKGRNSRAMRQGQKHVDAASQVVWEALVVVPKLVVTLQLAPNDEHQLRIGSRGVSAETLAGGQDTGIS